VIGDLVAFVVFATLGRDAHNEATGLSAIGQTLWTAFPFALGWFLVAPWLGAFKRAGAERPLQMLRRTETLAAGVQPSPRSRIAENKPLRAQDNHARIAVPLLRMRWRTGRHRQSACAPGGMRHDQPHLFSHRIAVTPQGESRSSIGAYCLL
jgi:hypothetical protein